MKEENKRAILKAITEKNSIRVRMQQVDEKNKVGGETETEKQWLTWRERERESVICMLRSEERTGLHCNLKCNCMTP